jgi:hypothetical protein
VIAKMLVVGVYEVIAGLALIVTGAFVGFDGWPSLIWGWALIGLGALLLILWVHWSVRPPQRRDDQPDGPILRSLSAASFPARG